ncbi:MAG: YbjN domain-containing protein [Actinomycetaceae bacterium]|nr:YbjN domain-containing protein [Actinomycetaceae bacterium]
MSWFKKASKEDESAGQVSIERVMARLASMEYNVNQFGDGEPACGAYFDGVPVTFLVLNDRFLVVKGNGWFNMEASRQAEVQVKANSWNSDTWFGTAYPFSDEDGLQVLCDYSFDCEKGVTDQQIDDTIGVGISVTVQCIEQMAEELGVEVTTN